MRSLFISDVHLGSRYAKSKELLAYLKHVRKTEDLEYLYIVGDLIDFWKLKRKWRWDDDATLVVRQLMSFVKEGVKVVYIAGNHDDLLRDFLEDFSGELGSVFLSNQVVHTTADGKRLLVLHGDQFDYSVKYAKWVCLMGDRGYEFLLWMNQAARNIQACLGIQQKWSLSKAVKQNVKRAVAFSGDFRKFLTGYAKKLSCDGVVCGHLHIPEIDDTDDLLYVNCGDWVESLTAAIECDDGTFVLEHFTDYARDRANDTLPARHRVSDSVPV